MGPAWQKWGLPGRRGGCQAACGCTCADRVRQEAEATRNQDQAQRPGHGKGISPHRKARGSVGPAAVNLVLRPLPLAFRLLPWVNELVRVLTESRWHLQASRAARGGTRGALSAWRLSLRSLFTPSGAWADSSPDLSLSALRNRRTGFGHRPPPTPEPGLGRLLYFLGREPRTSASSDERSEELCCAGSSGGRGRDGDLGAHPPL